MAQGVGLSALFTVIGFMAVLFQGKGPLNDEGMRIYTMAFLSIPRLLLAIPFTRTF